MLDGLVLETNYKIYRQNKTQEGIEYQDFVCNQLHKRGIVLQNMTSQKWQYRQENLLGMEIKFDGIMESSERIYIETHEKAEPRPGNYAPSGIYREDESWLYAIGNYKWLFVFGKKVLQRLDKANPSWLYRPPKDKPTSRGFCIPIDKAKAIAERVIIFE